MAKNYQFNSLTYRPRSLLFNTEITIQNRKESKVNGSVKNTYVNADPAIDYCSFKGMGGTENIQGGVLSVADTAEITMNYRPDITVKDRVLLSSVVYDVISVENLEQWNKYMLLKVRRVQNA